MPLCPNPRVRVTSPPDGAILRGTVRIQGSADIERFAYYKFELQPEGVSDWSFLARFDRSVTDGVLMTWDTTTALSGAYRLRLTVVDETGNYPEPCEVRIVVEN